MSAPVASTAPVTPPSSQWQRRLRVRNLTLIAIVGFALLSFVRVITGAQELTSAGTIQAALTSSIPIAMAGRGGVWAERAGIGNIGLEGMMGMGTCGVGDFGYH